MPKLRNIICQVQWAKTGLPFPEYKTTYGDGVVEAFIVVPSHPQSFRIQLTSTAFIHEGLAVFIYIDGRYHSNRNRVNLLPPKRGRPRERTEIDFVLRQKEQPLGDEFYLGREWRFDDHNIVPSLPEGANDAHFDMMGNIEVLVYRCVAENADDTNLSTTSSGAESDLEAWDRKLDWLVHDDNDDDEESVASPKASIITEKVEEELFPFSGLFDGPSDFYQPRHHPHNQGLGAWNWPSPPTSYRGPRGPAPSQAESSRNPAGWHSYHNRGPPPTREPSSSPPFRPGMRADRPPPEKRVHFDYGPPVDDSRYWDQDAHIDRQYDNPSLSGRGYHHGWDEHRGNYGPAEFSPGRPHPPAPHYHPRHYPQYGPPHAPSTTHHQPMHNVPPMYYRYHYNEDPSLFPPYPWMPPSASNVWWSPPGAHHKPGEKPGSLDPAKDENNSGNTDSVQGTKDDWNNDNNTDNRKNSEGAPGSSNGKNEKPNNGSGWGDNQTQDNSGWGNDQNENNDSGSGNGQNQDNNSASGWGNDQNQQSNGDWNNNVDSNNGASNNDWDNRSQANDDSKTNDWNNNDNSNRNDTNSSGWDNNNTSNSAPQNKNWSKPPASVTAGPQTSDQRSSFRPLYGPHGAYYATQSTLNPNLPWLAEEEPRYDVPQQLADEWGSSKQVQPGRGYRYYKRRCHISPIDKREEPYAKFVFKYRTKEELKNQEDIDVEVEPSGDKEVQEFQNMPKDDLIKLLLQAKGHLGVRIPSPPPVTADGADVPSCSAIGVEAPDMKWLDYDIPLRGGDDKPRNPNGPTGAGTSSSNGRNNGSWQSGNDHSSKNDGGDHGGNESKRERKPSNDWNSERKASNATAASVSGSTTQFPKESWDAAREQQKSGSPPQPPARTREPEW